MKEFDIEKIVAENEARKSQALQKPEEKLLELKKLKEQVEKDIKEQFGELVDDFTNKTDQEQHDALVKEQKNLERDIAILESNMKIIKANREN